MKFRQDINVLRAISITLVTVFHFFPKLLPNGYLGVDVFFIISGFLISLGILNDKANGHFSFADFYRRRVHRIIPGVLAMLLVVIVVESFILLPSDLINFSSSLQATLLFVSNIFFFMTGGYFGGNDALKPLLHMWSLSIEEQFYILFPMLFVLSMRFIKSHKGLIGFTLLIMIGSYLANIYLATISAQNAAFFLLPTRVWQFLVGTMAALVLFGRGGKTFGNQIYALLGLALIAVSAFFKVKFLPDASLISLGVFLIIINSLTIPSNAITNFIALIGRISFSLYLWHWPIASFLNYYNIKTIEPWQSLIGILLSTVLAYLSWKYVEERFRKPVNTKKLLIGIGVIYAILFAATQYIKTHQGLPQRFSQEVNETAATVDSQYRCPKFGVFMYGASRACVVEKNNDKNYDTATLGNSHSLMYVPVISDVTNKSLLVVSLNKCTPTFDMNVNALCRDQFKQNIDVMTKDPKIKKVIIGTTWSNTEMVNANNEDIKITHQDFNHSLLNTVQTLQKAGKDVYLIGPIDIPEPGNTIASNLSRGMALKQDTSFIKQSEPAAAFQNSFHPDIEFWKKQLGDHFIDTSAQLCDATTCYFRKDGITYFADDNHLSPKGAAVTKPSFEQSLSK